MAIREILVYPDQRLRQISRSVTVFDGALKALVQDMTDTMYDASGIGLAAIQINVPLRVVVMDLSENRDQPMVFVNPVITDLDQGRVKTDEGCLSVPGVYAEVERAQRVLIQAHSVEGEAFQMQADQLLCICIQHEVDHLQGKVFVDYLSRLKQMRLKKKLKREIRSYASQVA